jgi:hypothetical protein
VLGIELLTPFLIVWPRRLRHAGCATMIGLQLLIALTGNYAYFNFLTITLCVLLLDDRAVERCRRSVVRWRPPGAAAAGADGARLPIGPGRRLALAGVALVVVPVSGLALAGELEVEPPGAPLVQPLARLARPFRSINAYGLFAVMTTSRPEIIVEGSVDGVTWRAYEFRYKPGAPARGLSWVAPHQPRLDWQLWFAALTRYDAEPWFGGFCTRLLQASPVVLRLLAHDPFDGRAPRYVRAMRYEYRFATAPARRANGVWWTRTSPVSYSPVLSLRP